jgi:xeroderma pigmentosum group C-complementing protein
MEKPDFRDHARKLKGSRDVGAQLFCALLRSVGVTARLVCSLQSLPFNFAAVTKGAMPQKSQPRVIYAAEDSQGNTSEETGSVDVHNMNVKAGSKSGPDQGAMPQTPMRAKRLWQPKFGSGSRDLGGASPAPKGELRSSLRHVCLSHLAHVIKLLG